MRYFFFALLFAITSCSDKQNNSNDINSNENRYSDDQVYFFGDIALLKKNNLPLTGYKLEYDQGGGYSETYYINGLKEGGKRDYYPGGSLKSESNYKNGELDGQKRGYYKNGSLEYKYNYTNGEMNGFSNSWYENGRKRGRTYYRDGKIAGKSIDWYDNGQVAEISTYRDGLRMGWQRAYLKNGDILYEVNLINGNGKIIYQSADYNVQITEEYIEGEKIYPSDGILNFVEPTIEPIELSTYSFKKGELEMSVWREPEGISTRYYKNGLDHGKHNEFYKNGQKHFEREYFFDQEDGVHQMWYENGKLQEIRKYDKGILISANCWDESGKEVECDCYDNGGKKIKCP